MKLLSILFLLLISYSYASAPLLTIEDKEAIIAQAKELHENYSLCEDEKVAGSEVRIDRVMEVDELQVFAQTYYYCNGTSEKIKDEYCIFKKDLNSNSWFIQYCD